MSEMYTCEICGTAIDWDGADDVQGEVWGCSICGKCFCTKCFSDRFSRKTFIDISNTTDYVYCPDCWEKEMSK